MNLSKKQITQLTQIIAATQQILADANGPARPRQTGANGKSAGGTRRRGADLKAFKKTIKAERKAGASVAELAQKHSVTPSYIYQLR